MIKSGKKPFNLNSNSSPKRALAMSVVALIVSLATFLFPIPKHSGGGALAANDGATPSIGISSSGLINLSPVAGGVTDSNSATITTTTTNYTGYNLYLSSTDNKMTLIGGTSSDVIESITSSTAPTSDAFENRWGYKIDSAVSYNPIPITQDEIASSSTAVPSGEAKTLTLAARAGKTKAQGAYIGNLTVTAIANANKIYSITYNKNTSATVADMPTDTPQTTTTSTTVSLSSNTPARTNYLFQGWCTVSVADGETCTGTSHDPGDVITLDATTANAINLYAVWEKNIITFDKAFANAGKTKVSGTNYYALQDMTPVICSAIDLLQTGILIDTRDNNKTYTVAKLDDTNCWMTQNLTLGSSSLGSIKLTSEKSDVSSEFTLPTPTTTSFSTSNYNVVNYRNYTTNNSNYYNWYTATAGTGTKSTAAYTAATSSICPKGWRLPNGSAAANAAGEYAELLYAAGITSTLATSTTSVNYATGGKNKMTAAPYNIATTYGYFNTTGAAPTGTSYSSFWTNRTYSSANYAWSTYIGSSSATLNYGTRYKSQGLPIRCVAHRASIQPTITYNANGGTGSIANQTASSASEFAQSLTLSNGTGMTRTNYALVGWSTNPNATPTTAEYVPGQTISTNSNLNLYAIWYDISSLTSFDSAFASASKTKDTATNLYKMQDMNSTICGNTTNTEITTYTVSTQLVDARDGKIYWVSKLKDGNCWMTQNLDYDISSSTNTISNLDGTTGTWTSSSTYPPQATSSTLSSSTSYTGTYSWNPGDYYIANGGSGISTACTTWGANNCTTAVGYDLTSTSAKGNTNLHYHLGNYYQWNAATAGTGGTITSADANSSICPAGWRLPTSTSYTNNYSFGKLTNAYGITNSTNGTSDAKLLSSPLWFVRAGGVYDGDLSGQGSYGDVWSSRAYSNSNLAYYLVFNSSGVNPSNYNGRDLGFSVRCVAE